MIIYCLYCRPLGKCYIGQSRYNSLNQRYDRNLHWVHSKPLKKAVEQYGPESFERQILAQPKSQKTIDELEKLWIALLRTRDRKYGFNQQSGGRRGNLHDEKTRQRITTELMRRWTPAMKKRMSKIIRQVWASRTAEEKKAIGQKIRLQKLGSKHTRLTRLQISLSMKRKEVQRETPQAHPGRIRA